MNNKVFHNIIFEHLNNIYLHILTPKEINDLTFEVVKLSTNRKVKKVFNTSGYYFSYLC